MGQDTQTQGQDRGSGNHDPGAQIHGQRSRNYGHGFKIHRHDAQIHVNADMVGEFNLILFSSFGVFCGGFGSIVNKSEKWGF